MMLSMANLVILLLILLEKYQTSKSQLLLENLLKKFQTEFLQSNKQKQLAQCL